MDSPTRNIVKPAKAYNNTDYLHSRAARPIRILCEMEETLQRLRDQDVAETIMFFGSARSKNRKQWDKAVKDSKKSVAAASLDEKKALEEGLTRLLKTEWMCEVNDKVVELSRQLTQWAVSEYAPRSSAPGSKKGHLAVAKEVPAGPKDGANKKRKRNHTQSLCVCTGGGPGLMEAANRGAAMVEDGRSIGMGISLPFEDRLNDFVTPELAFEFHYFFTRKYWMAYPCRALIVAPGGFGTMDELFELMTLKQTKKINFDMPIVLFGEEFWRKAINFEVMVDMGVISARDYESLYFTSDPNDAFKYVTSRIQALNAASAAEDI